MCVCFAVQKQQQQQQWPNMKTQLPSFSHTLIACEAEYPKKLPPNKRSKLLSRCDSIKIKPFRYKKPTTFEDESRVQSKPYCSSSYSL